MVSRTWLLLALALNACAGQTRPSPGSPPAVFGPQPRTLRFPGDEALPPVPADGFEVRMQRSGCFGICPSYELMIHADGAVAFVGRAHVGAAGPQQGQADPQALELLRDKLREADAAGRFRRYARGSPDCGVWATDMPTVKLDAYFGSRWHRLVHDQGCASAPSALRDLENAVDRAARTEQWGAGQPIE